MDRERRLWLKAGLAAGGLWLPAPLFAQAEGATRLLRAPRSALVIGNSAYGAVPALVNPGNDARAIAGALKASGFAVDLALDGDRPRMLERIEAHCARLAAEKGVGIFYFAGHGLQLDWHNYMLPVNATANSAAEIPAQGVDIDVLIAGLARARNAMNLIILDACRDNPFGSKVALQQKGLSQMDAPPGTLLAYATSPGNVASDGRGEHGLYTQHLLREMPLRGAKIEDVFKRVRLGVRRDSRGAQIPWESTSLEEDFYFVPPELRRRSQEDDEREFGQELEEFQRAEGARNSAAVIEFLRRYPSGRFAELAQLRLDRLLAAEGEKPIEIGPAAGNPKTAGSQRADLQFKVGDMYAYRNIDRRQNTTRDVRLVVTSISDNEVHFNQGALVLDPLGNTIQLPDGRRFTPRQDQPLEYAVGRRWSTRFGVSRGEAHRGVTDMDFRIAAKERVVVPAGTFDCYRVEGRGVMEGEGGGRRRSEVEIIYWTAPDRVRRPIAREEVRRGLGRMRFEGHSERSELIGFRQS